MMNFFKDYNGMVIRPQWSWLKKHWKGYTVFVGVVLAVEAIWWYWDEIKTRIQKRFKKNEEES